MMSNPTLLNLSDSTDPKSQIFGNFEIQIQKLTAFNHLTGLITHP
jgi:hypothetical protein